MGRGIRGITRDLYESHGRDFQKQCYNWLKFIHPEILDAKDLGEIDREGVDLYILDSSREYYLKAFQCKGFEKSFDDSQLKQCSKSIEAFLKAGVRTKEYYLVVNVQLNKEFSEKLLKELNNLVESKVAENVFLLNSNAFVTYYNKQLKATILEKILESNKTFYDDYTSIMEQNFYYEAVPFLQNETTSFSPLKFIKAEINNCIEREVKGQYYFLASEFGFGKTTTLLQLYKQLIKEDYIAIYIPVTTLKSNAFYGTSGLTREIFRILFNDIEFDESDKILKFSSESMTSLLQNEKKIILMFDGLDEHLQFYKLEGLRALFNSTAEFKATCIFGFRKSYWEERFEDFKLALSKSKNKITSIFLIEWTENNISEYIDMFKIENSISLKESEMSHLKELQLLINDNQYGKYYGDIPKRPLFLQMIIRDVLSDKIKHLNIGELYFSYFKEKFFRDIQGQFESFTPQREVPENYGVDYLFHVMMEIHESVAGYCIKNEIHNINEAALIENTIHEKDIRMILDKYDLTKNLSKFITLSVLTPISKRGNMNMRLKFVHKSFLEFFIARRVSSELLIDTSSWFGGIQHYCRYEYPDSILNFIGACLETEIKHRGVDKVKIAIENKIRNRAKLTTLHLYLINKLNLDLNTSLLIKEDKTSIEKDNSFPF